MVVALRGVILAGLAAWLAGGIGIGGAIAAPPALGGAAPRGSRLEFYGWSPDSRLVAYTRVRMGRTRPDQRMHRFVADGRFTGFGRKVGADVARYAHERGYLATPAEKRRASETRLEFRHGDAAYALSLEIGRAEGWRLTRDDAVLAAHTFDRIYVGFDAELYPSPDGRQAVLVMHLDTGWEIDAAIFPVSLVDHTQHTQ